MQENLLAVAMRGAIILAAVAVPVNTQAADQDGVREWSNDELKRTFSQLLSEANRSEIGGAVEQIVKMPTHSIFLASKDKPAKEVSELHEHNVDIFVVKEGGGTLQLGGEIVEPTSSEPGEIRGTGIRGGQMLKVSAGDIIYIPKNTPHLWHFNDGQYVYYIAVKATE